jgi:hypothetical protein
MVSRASYECCLSERDSSKTLSVGVGERRISRTVVKGENDDMLNFFDFME